MPENNTALLEVKDLKISFKNRKETKEVVHGISFAIEKGKTMAVVGESGSGKSVTALSLTQLLPKASTSIQGTVNYKGVDLLQAKGKTIQKIRGKEIAYIFQEPSTSLNPVYTIGNQISEAIRLHIPGETDVKKRCIEYLNLVGIREADKRINAYPHELSGGMQQRVMIAMALACEPKVLIADEPTTALDVTIQKQIMDLLMKLKKELDMSIILITHNFGIVNGFADDVIVMYQGNIVERGEAKHILQSPKHAYTKALLGCIPKLGENKRRLTTIDHELIGQ